MGTHKKSEIGISFLNPTWSWCRVVSFQNRKEVYIGVPKGLSKGQNNICLFMFAVAKKLPKAVFNELCKCLFLCPPLSICLQSLSKQWVFEGIHYIGKYIPPTFELVSLWRNRIAILPDCSLPVSLSHDSFTQTMIRWHVTSLYHLNNDGKACRGLRGFLLDTHTNCSLPSIVSKKTEHAS